MTEIEQNYLIPLQAVRQTLWESSLRVHMPQRLGLLQNQSRMHFHSHPELFIQLGGRRYFTCPLETFELHAGDICPMPPQLPHRENAYHLPHSPFEGIVLWAEGGAISIHRSIILKHENRPGVGPQHLRLDSADSQTINQLLEHATLLTEPDIRNPLLYALLGLVYNNLHDYDQKKPALTLKPTVAIVESARAIIHAYLPDASLTVHRIASEVGCSADHLSRCFQKQLGLSAQHYLQNERLRLACRLLKKPNLRISEVAQACGFNSANYFIRCFRTHMNQTPKSYRYTAKQQTSPLPEVTPRNDPQR